MWYLIVMNRGAELLTDWRNTKSLTQAAAAALLDTWPSKLSRWECGRVVPGLRNATLIAKVTEGVVPSPSWLEPPKHKYED